MIGITERAKSELKTILSNNVDNPLACLRLKADEQGQLGLAIDVEMPEDGKVEYEGATLVVAEQELAENLKHLVIDVEDTEEGSCLVIAENPEKPVNNN